MTTVDTRGERWTCPDCSSQCGRTWTLCQCPPTCRAPAGSPAERLAVRWVEGGTELHWSEVPLDLAADLIDAATRVLALNAAMSSTVPGELAARAVGAPDSTP